MLVYLLIMCLMASLFSSVTATPHVMQGVRSGWHSTFARIVFDVRGDIPYEVVPTEDASKIVVTFPSISQLPPLHISRTNTPIIKSIHFVEKQGQVAAEIQLEGAGSVRKHYRISSPTRIVVDVVMPPEGATAHKTQAARPVKQEPKSVASAPTEALVTPQQGQAIVLEQAHVLAAQGLVQEAKKFLKSALPTAEGTLREQMLRVLGTLALQTGQPAEAVPYLRQGLETVSAPAERATLFARLGEGYAALGQEKEGLQAFQQCKELATAAAPSSFPTAETCQFRAAELLLAQQQYQPALAAYQQLLAAFPQTIHRDWVLLRIAILSRGLPDLEQMQNTLAPLRDTSASPLWQKVATEALEEAGWQRQFHERLAEFQNRLMR